MNWQLHSESEFEYSEAVTERYRRIRRGPQTPVK
jgi:hypothetical protein